MKSYKIPFLLLVASFCVRLIYYLLEDAVVSPDVFDYVKLSRRLISGDFAGGLDPYWTPLFPFLIAAASFFTDSYLTPVLAVSIVTGSLAAVAVYYFTEQSYGQRTAIIAAVIAVFYPHLLRSTFDLGTENLYLLFMTFSLSAFWKATTKNSARHFFLTGVLLGFGYLTRPEAFGYLLFFVPLPVLDRAVSRQKIFSVGLFKNASLLLLGFALLGAPYVLYLRNVTGAWTISAKFSHHVVGANPSDKELDMRIRNALESPSYVRESGKLFVRAAFFILHKIHKNVFPYLFPPFLLIIVGVGLFRTKWSHLRLRRELYLSLFCAATVFCYALTVAEVRYFYVLLPILIGWVARGIVEMEDWLRQSLPTLSKNGPVSSRLSVFSISLVLLINLYVLPLNSFMRSTEQAWYWSRFEQKRAGLWLRENAPSRPRIMSADFRPAFYAQGDHIPVPPDDFEAVLAQAVSRQVDFLVIDERNLKDRPSLITLLEEPGRPELEMVYHSAEQPGYRIAVYRVKKISAPLADSE